MSFILGSLLPPFLLTKFMFPLFISCICIFNYQVLIQLAYISPTASPIYIYQVVYTTPIKTLL